MESSEEKQLQTNHDYYLKKIENILSIMNPDDHLLFLLLRNIFARNNYMPECYTNKTRIQKRDEDEDECDWSLVFENGVLAQGLIFFGTHVHGTGIK